MFVSKIVAMMIKIGACKFVFESKKSYNSHLPKRNLGIAIADTTVATTKTNFVV
jgi:hypothetical protein